MRIQFLTAFLSMAFATASAASSKVQKYDGDIVAGRYIVKLKAGVQATSILRSVAIPRAKLTHEWTQGTSSDSFIGFAGDFSPKIVEELLASPGVDYIAEDGIIDIFSLKTQTNAPWGLGRISQDAKLANQNASALTFAYTYDTSGGAGVDIYIVDTGVYIEHNEFFGRGTWGATFGGYANADGNGHGTHVAGTAAGTLYGVAKKSKVIAVKVLSDAGSGSTSNIISGITWVAQAAQASGRPSVILLAVGGGISAALDSAVTSVISSGIHVVTAAGNSNMDASNVSPARVPAAITVGTSTIGDTRSLSSNYGPSIDVFAPGQNVLSAWIGSPSATNTLSGSSMAAAHVAGLVAYDLGVTGTLSPASISTLIQSSSVKGALTGITSPTLNQLASNKV